MDDSLVGAVLGISADDVQALLYDANPDVELGAVDLPVFQTSVDLDYDQMAGLPNAPVQILPDPEEGSMWLPFWAFLQMDEQGDFGGWDNTTNNDYLALFDSAFGGGTRRLVSSAPGTIDDFFIDGGGLLMVPEVVTVLPAGAYPPGEQVRSTVQPLDASVLDKGVVLRAIRSGFPPDDFVPNDEGGYPDSHMRVTIAYAQIVKYTD